MNDSFRWVKVGDTTHQLEGDDDLLATLSYNEVEDLWYLDFDCLFANTVFLPKCIDKLKVDAVEYICEYSKLMIDRYQRIQYSLLKEII